MNEFDPTTPIQPPEDLRVRPITPLPIDCHVQDYYGFYSPKEAVTIGTHFYETRNGEIELTGVYAIPVPKPGEPLPTHGDMLALIKAAHPDATWMGPIGNYKRKGKPAA